MKRTSLSINSRGDVAMFAQVRTLVPGQLRVSRYFMKMSGERKLCTLIGPVAEDWTQTSSRAPYWWVFRNGKLTYVAESELREMWLVLPEEDKQCEPTR